MGLVAITEANLFWLAATAKAHTIDKLLTKKNRTIKIVSDDSHNINNGIAIGADSTRFAKIKLAKSNNLIQLNKFGTDFFISEIKLVFTKLKQVLIKISIIYQFILRYYIQIEINISRYAISRVLR